jgi:paraquat-inducible protein B
MAVDKSYWRLGLFTLVALVVVLATGLVFIQRLKSRAAISLVTYTTENVAGLDVSSPVRYRGVSVGRVTEVRVDPRGIIIEIDFEVFLDRLIEIGMNVSRIQEIADVRGMFPRLRAQLISNPVSGEAYLLLDSPQNPPPAMKLEFIPSREYVPSMPSNIARLQDRLPALMDRADATLQTLREIVAKIPDSLERSDQFFTNVQRIMEDSQLPELSADSRKFFTTTSAQMGEIASQLDGLVGKNGALLKASEEARAAIEAADFPSTTRSTREAAESSRLAADDLRRSLPALRNSLEQLRDLARELEEQPESLVYGPRPKAAKHQ